MDLAEARESWPVFEAAMRAAGRDAVAISADTGEGLDALRLAVGAMLPDFETMAAPPDPAGVVIHRLEAAGDGFTLEREGDMYVLHGKRIERLVNQTNFDNEESAERFQRELQRSGIDGALRRAGVRPGDDVRIGSTVLAWEPAEVGE
jgi:GTP-binding protein